MNIAICSNDQAVHDIFKAYTDKFTQTGFFFSSGIEFLYHWSPEQHFDMVFLDTAIAEIDETDLGSVIRSQNEELPLVLISSDMDHVLTGYDLSALYYLLKPVSEAAISKSIGKARKIMQKQRKRIDESMSGQGNFLIIQKGKKEVIPYFVIEYFEADRHCMLLHTTEKMIRIVRRLSDIEKNLDDKQFIRIHRSYLVNMQHIVQITRLGVHMKGGAVLPVSQGRWEAVNAAFIHFCRRASRAAQP